MSHVFLEAWHFDSMFRKTRDNEEVEAEYEAIQEIFFWKANLVSSSVRNVSIIFTEEL
jgi:hypothetical protein